MIVTNVIAPPAPPCRLDVICEGNPFSMGLAQGRACIEKLAQLDVLLKQLEGFRLAQPRWLPYRLFLRYCERRATRLVHKPLLRDDRDSLERLLGIGSGSGVRLRLLYLINALECMMASPRRCTVIPPLGACSAVAVRGGRSATGGALIARNFDYLPLVQPLYTLRESRPTGQYRSLDFTMAPLAGTVDGVNERGLCITYDYGFAIDDAHGSGPPISASISAALERCSTTSEAISFIRSRPRWGGGLLMLADAEGDIASLELSTTCSEVRRPAAGEDVLFHTNAFSTGPMQSVQVSAEAHFTRRAPIALRNQRPLDSSAWRDARFIELLSQRDRFGWDELTEVMSDHGPVHDTAASNNSSHGLCVHSDYWNTTACLQLEPHRRSMRIAYGPTCQAVFQEFAL